MKARVSEYEEAMKAFDDLTKHTGYQAKEGPTYEEFAESFIGLFPYNFLRKSYVNKLFENRVSQSQVIVKPYMR